MKRSRVKLIDDSSFLVKREKFARPKPDAWFRSEPHKSHVRGLRCLNCGREPPERATDDTPRNEAAHVRKGTDGAARKEPSDYFVLPLCHYCHRSQHVQGEVTFWAFFPDPIRTALELALKSPCDRTREAAFEEHRRRYG
jgi:hypothetical protein